MIDSLRPFVPQRMPLDSKVGRGHLNGGGEGAWMLGFVNCGLRVTRKVTRTLEASGRRELDYSLFLSRIHRLYLNLLKLGADFHEGRITLSISGGWPFDSKHHVIR